MSDNERELLQLIREHNNPTKALEIAIETILGFLERDESFQEQPVVYVQELA